MNTQQRTVRFWLLLLSAGLVSGATITGISIWLTTLVFRVDAVRPLIYGLQVLSLANLAYAAAVVAFRRRDNVLRSRNPKRHVAFP